MLERERNDTDVRTVHKDRTMFSYSSKAVTNNSVEEVSFVVENVLSHLEFAIR